MVSAKKVLRQSLRLGRRASVRAGGKGEVPEIGAATEITIARLTMPCLLENGKVPPYPCASKIARNAADSEEQDVVEHQSMSPLGMGDLVMSVPKALCAL